jgi:hypothetical protein
MELDSGFSSLKVLLLAKMLRIIRILLGAWTSGGATSENFNEKEKQNKWSGYHWGYFTLIS